MEELFGAPAAPKTRVWDEEVPILTNGRVTDVYIQDAIAAPFIYNELCYKLSNALKGDIFNIHLNTPGGHVDAGYKIIDALKNTKAKTVAYISGTVASAGTMITMYCDALVIAPYTSFMIHNYSHGAQGTGSQVKTYVDFIDKEAIRVTKEVYAGFITEHEMSQISTADKELWLNTEETLNRWEAKKGRGEIIPKEGF